jgi:elongation factor G
MTAIDASKTRTFALIGHAGDGKTTLADSIVMAAGVTNRLGSVDQGTSFMNYLPEEKTRRLSISTSICSFERDGFAFTVLDAPGDANFTGEMRGALAASDCAVLVLSAQDGPKLGTTRAYQQARAMGAAVVAIANKADAERADFDAAAAKLEEAFSVRVVKLHLPLHQGLEYDGYVDLLTNRAHVYDRDGSGKVQIGAVPADLADAVEAARTEMVEAAAEGDDAILEKYLEQGEISEEEIRAALHKGVREGKIIPLLSGAGQRNIGGATILALAQWLFPGPGETAQRKGRVKEEERELAPDPTAHLAAYVFKSIADRYAGMLSVCRVVSGTLRADSSIANARTGTKERITKLLRLSGEHTEDVKEVGPGQLVAIPKLKDTRTGDSLCDDKHPISILGPEAPRGVISFAVEAANKGEEDKVFDALHRLVEEDQSLHLGRDERTGEFLLSGLGQLHIEVTLEKLRRMFKVDMKLKPPRVPYRETVRGRAENVEGKLKKQSGGRGQFGVCYLTVEPGARGSGVQFVDEIVGGSIPRQFIPAVEKGVIDTCKLGVVAGYPVTDIVIRCTDGKYHAVDSSEMAFKTAGSLGLKAAFQLAKPTLLEPIMNMHITIPDEFTGDVMGNLNSRRGRVSGVDAQGTLQTVSAHVPMSEVLTYASDLTSITGGQGSFTMEFSHYEEVPKEVQERIIAEAAAPAHEE